jgi:hypothetical protein
MIGRAGASGRPPGSLADLDRAGRPIARADSKPTKKNHNGRQK